MTFNEKLHDAERGILIPLSTSSPAEKFLLFRDISFVCILVLHLGSAISAIPALVTHTAAPNTHGYLAVVIMTGIIAPILCVLGYRSHLRISKITSAMWFEVSWITVLMVVDFIIAVSYSTVSNATKTMIGLTFTQMIFTMIYALGLGAMVLLQHRKFPQVNIWRSPVHTVQWLRSPESVDPFGPPASGPFFISAGKHPKQFLAPWNRDSRLETKHADEKSKYSISPMLPSVYDGDAHPFWQERVQHQATVEDNMAYVVERYGLSVDAPRPRPQLKAGKHGRRPSIRDLEISRPVPVVTTVRRANTLASAQLDRDAPRRYQHQRSSSMITQSTSMLERGRPGRAAPPPALRLRSPSPISSINYPLIVDSRCTTPKPGELGAPKTINPMSVSPTGTSAVKLSSPEGATRAQGLAGRTLVGASRPKASGTRADVDISKPLPSPPPMSTDESLMSSGLSTQSGPHQFVMSIAQRVKVGATKMRPMIISTPKQGDFFGDLDLDLDDEKKDEIWS